MNAVQTEPDDHLNVKQEIEAHERELQALLTRVLPVGELLAQLEVQLARVDGVSVALGDLRAREIPVVLQASDRAEAAIKRVGRSLDALREDYEEGHGSLLKLVQDHIDRAGAHVVQQSEALASIYAEVQQQQRQLQKLVASVREQLEAQQRELIPLVQPLADGVAGVRIEVIDRQVALADQISAFSRSQRIADEQATSDVAKLRRLVIGSLILGSLTVAGTVALLVNGSTL